MSKDKKKKHKKKQKDKKKDVMNTPEQTTYEFTYTPFITFSPAPTTYSIVWRTYSRTSVPQEFQDAFEDGELEP